MTNKLNVLILDDNEDDQILLDIALRKIKEYEIETFSAGDSKQATEILSGKRIDFVFADYLLLEGNSESFVGYAKNCLRNIPVVVMSGLSPQQVKSNGYRAGADAFLSKDNIIPSVICSTMESASFISSLRHRIELTESNSEQQVAKKVDAKMSSSLDFVLNNMIDQVSENVEGDILTVHNVINQLKALSAQYG